MESMMVFYPCKDIEETSRFYQEVLGLRLYNDQGKCKIFDTGYGYQGFCQYSHGELASHVCISFNCKNEAEVDKTYTLFRDTSKYQCTKPQRHPEFAVYSFFMKDPNGYTVEFQKILEP